MGAAAPVLDPVLLPDEPWREQALTWIGSLLDRAILTGMRLAFEAAVRPTEHDLPLPESACVYCGNCIQVCPTGALMFKTEYDMRAAGTWDESRQTQTDTVCAYCGVGCNLTLHVQDNTIVKVMSPADSSITHGNLCIKGRFGFQHAQNRPD